jgi:N-acetyl-gamma-glutamylphosphate reductase
MNQLDVRGNISTRLKQSIAYADDILITARTTQAAIDTFQKLKEQSYKYGLWEVDVMADLRIQNVKNWRNCIQDRQKWKDIVEKAKTYKG